MRLLNPAHVDRFAQTQRLVSSRVWAPSRDHFNIKTIATITECRGQFSEKPRYAGARYSSNCSRSDLKGGPAPAEPQVGS